jgi:hypothetical protein
VKSVVEQGSTLGPLLLNIFTSDICTSIHNFSYLLFADDLKIYCNVADIENCKLLQRGNTLFRIDI